MNRDTPLYKEWRTAVLKRDGYKCQMPGCDCKYRKWLQAHHIMRWADAPRLRYEVSNGLTLCKKCHYSIRNIENNFIGLFSKIAIANENN